jgi:hypothetical protein
MKLSSVSYFGEQFSLLSMGDFQAAISGMKMRPRRNDAQGRKTRISEEFTLGRVSSLAA